VLLETFGSQKSNFLNGGGGQNGTKLAHFGTIVTKQFYIFCKK